MKKPKFTPEITRIKLNPEQAVLSCSCYSNGRAGRNRGNRRSSSVCKTNYKTTQYCDQVSSTAQS